MQIMGIKDSLTIGEGLKRREDNFLLLRVIAAIMVIYGHSFATSPSYGAHNIFVPVGLGRESGALAVDMFFVLSGFMVSASYGRRGDLYHFLLARTLRIVPALAVCVLLSALVIGPLFTTLSMGDYFSRHETYTYILQNLRFASRMQWNLPGVFDANHYSPAVNGSIRTLPAEFRMYLFLAIVGAIGFLRHKTTFSVLIAGLVLAGVFAPGLLPLPPGWVHFAGYFILGIVAFVFKDYIGVRSDCLVVLIAATYVFRSTALSPYIFPVTLAYLCFWFGYRLSLPKIERFGDPSYAAYLWGWPLLQMFACFFPHANSYAAFATCSLAALAFGYASFHAVEKPMLALKNTRILVDQATVAKH